MTELADLVVVGAGPAGAWAAIEASRAGLDVMLLDEAAAAGGQVYRAPARAAPGRPDPDRRAGDALRAALAASSVRHRPGRRVWSVTPGFQVDSVGPDGPERVRAPRLVASTGAYERVVPFPGWTLPGVVGLAAATALLKSQAMSPGRRVLVAGCGPLLAAVGAKLAASGVEVAAVVDLSSPGEWIAAFPALATRPGLLAQGLGWVAALARRRVPVLFRHAVLRAEGTDAVARVQVGPVDAAGRPSGGRERWFDADALAVGHGLSPSSEIPRLLHAEHRFDALRGGWVPVTDPSGRTSVSGLFAAGDGAGVAGAAPAALAGRLAGLAAAADAGRGAPGTNLLPERDRALRFADAVAALIRPRPGLLDAVPDDTVVCRCEDVTRGEIEAAIAAGAREVNQLKHFTRCGMGPCQGRVCGETVAGLVARHAGSREVAGRWSMRPPLRPVPLDALLGGFTYDDIPVPEPAPL